MQHWILALLQEPNGKASATMNPVYNDINAQDFEETIWTQPVFNLKHCKIFFGPGSTANGVFVVSLTSAPYTFFGKKLQYL